MLPTGSIGLLPKGRIEEISGFDEARGGYRMSAASLPARLMGDVAGKRVADLCAAPGGKTAQLALAGAKVTAVDSSKTRLGLVRENLDRLGLAATVIGDAATFKPEEKFDAVLLDAPCSSTGTIRRHPDIPYVKSAEGHRRACRAASAAARQCRDPCSNPAAGWSIPPAGWSPRRARRRSPPCSSATMRCGSPRSARTSSPDRPSGSSPRAVFGTFPYDLKFDSPEWSGMDGFSRRGLLATINELVDKRA